MHRTNDNKRIGSQKAGSRLKLGGVITNQPFIFLELTRWSVLLRCMTAIFIGGIIGLERGMKNRAAGFRTYMLVCLGSCIVMLTNQYINQLTGTGDPVRMGAQVISGIGFLGAGTIIVTSRSQIKGLTTAAGLWAAACLGLSIGVGFYEVAIVGGICILLVMTVFHTWEDFMRRHTKVLTIYIELMPHMPLSSFLREARKKEMGLSNVQIEPDHGSAQDTVCLLATIKQKKNIEKEQLFKTLRGFRSVQFLEEL